MSENRRRKKFVAVLAAVLLAQACFLLAGCEAGGKPEDGLEELEVSSGGENAGEPGEDSGGKAAEKSGEDSEVAASGDSGGDSGQAAGDSSGNGSGEGNVYVYVCGAVNAPGVYELKEGARVFEAIQLAGGLTEAAAADAVNQARIVTDGEQIRVPTVEEAQNQGAGVAGEVTEGTENNKININTAGKEELMTLTGIGEAKAESIMDYREKNGSFTSIEELMQIEGIKEGVFNKIKDDITI